MPTNKNRAERIAHLEQMKQMNDITIKRAEQDLEEAKGLLEKAKISNELIDNEWERLF